MPFPTQLARTSRKSRGVSLTGYGLLVGLIAVTAIVAVSGTGSNVEFLFGRVSTQLETVNTGANGGAGSGAETATTPSDPCDGTLGTGDEGTECDDGTIFAGSSNGNPLFVDSSDEGSMPFASGSGFNTGANSNSDGLSNTNTLKALHDAANGQTFPAANACATKTTGGHQWYLPARDELTVIFEALVENNQAEAEGTYNFVSGSGSGARMNSTRYWSSSDTNTANPYLFWMSDGYFLRYGNSGHGFNRPTRCVRRG
ncbi:MAG: hypothetical protein Alpg2KO_09800 [Alphaproteobacteria bacterium]